MSDSDETLKHEIEDISFDDMVRFLEVVTPDKKCLYCGGVKFSLNTKRDDRKFIQLVTYGVYGRHEKIYPVIIMSCQKCGGVYNHKYSFVKKWLDANPVVSDDNIVDTPEIEIDE